jgi:hypothetical protein
MPRCLLFDAMSYRTRGAGRRSIAPRGIVALGAIAGLVMLLAGCGGSTSSAPAGAGTGAGAHEGGGIGGRSSSSGQLLNPARETAGTGNISNVAAGALFGGNAALVPEEAALGRRLAIIRVYYHIGESFPQPGNRKYMAKGSTLLVSLDTSVAMHGPSYASIAAGHEDGSISSFLKSVNQAAVQYHLGAIYIDFEHEADDSRHLPLGSPAQFDRAWDHVHQLAVDQHLDWNQGGRLHWVLVLVHNAYSPGSSRVTAASWAGQFWPGSGEVDAVAADGYNSYSCHLRLQNAPLSNPSPAQLFDPVVAFAATHGGLPVFITEWGVDTTSRANQVQFIQQMQSFVAANREIAGALYWDSVGNRCSYIVDGNAAAVAALAAMGRSTALQGRVMPAQ